MRFRALPTCAVALALLASCGQPDAAPRIRLATTTSTDDSGLLAWLLPPFEAREGVRIDVIAVGTGQALAIAGRGDADIVMVHARSKEDEFVAKGDGIDRRDLMWNDFVILGPAEDPAGAKGAPDAAGAMGRVAAAKATFVSRGDESGTHVREKALWKAAGVTPDWPGLKSAGQGMGECLNIAGEMRGYVLSDRGTWLAFRGKAELSVLVEGDPALRNPYGVILVNPARHPGVNAEGARKLLDYLVSPEGQARIAAFQVDGETLFHPFSEN